MREKKIKIDGTNYVLRELTFVKSLEAPKDSKEATFWQLAEMLKEPKMTSDEVKALPSRIGFKLLRMGNEMMGFRKLKLETLDGSTSSD